MSARKEWVARYQAGETLQQIATSAGVSLQTVWSHLQKQGVPMRPRGNVRGTKLSRKGRPSWHAEAVALRAQGLTLKAIGQRFGVSFQAVHQALRSMAP